MGQGSGCLLDHLWHCDLGVLFKGIHHEPVAPDVVHALRVGAKHQRPLSNSGEALLWAGDMGSVLGRRQMEIGFWLASGDLGNTRPCSEATQGAPASGLLIMWKHQTLTSGQSRGACIALS